MAACLGGPSASAQSTANQLVQNVGLDQHLDAQVPLELAFRDEDGKSVTLSDYLGDRPVVLNFVYFRCPMLCTQVLNGLLKTSQSMNLHLGDDYRIVSVSIDPRETPEMAAAKKERYLSRYHGAGGPQGWHFLTGDQAAIEQLTRAAGFRYVYDEASDQYAHASGLLVLTPEGKISRYYYGIDYHPTDLRLGLVESSQGKIGSPVDQFLLLCYHYDPATGKYGLVIHNVIRIAGTITLLALGTFLLLMYRLERRRSQEAPHAKSQRRKGGAGTSIGDSGTRRERTRS